MWRSFCFMNVVLFQFLLELTVKKVCVLKFSSVKRVYILTRLFKFKFVCFQNNQLKNQGLNQKSVQTGASICHLNCPSCRVLVGNKRKIAKRVFPVELCLSCLRCLSKQPRAEKR